jgi:hypothetical protein
MELTGKILVFATLVLSLLCCAYGVVMFADPTDWGWDKKYQAKDAGQPVLSELDKSKLVVEGLAKEKARAFAEWKKARDSLARLDLTLASNQAWYNQEISRLRSVGEFNVRTLKQEDTGRYVLDPPQGRTGRPVYDKVVAKKTFDKYLGDLADLLTKIDSARSEVDKSIAQEKRLTEELNGPVDQMGKQQKGLYALVGIEEDVRRRALEEVEDIKPVLYQELVDSQSLLRRRDALRYRLAELKNVGVARGQP